MIISHNQSDPALIDGIDSATIGIGAFLVGDFLERNRRRPLKVQVIEDLDYRQCLELGQFALAFKWLPDSTMTHFEIDSLINDAQCEGLCEKTCKKFGCWCVDGICEQIPATRI